MDNKEKKNEQDIINTQVEPHNHRAIIGFDKNGVPNDKTAAVASIGDETVSYALYTAAFDSYLSYMEQMGYDPVSNEEELQKFRDWVLEYLVKDMVVLYRAKEEGFKLSDEQIAESDAQAETELKEIYDEYMKTAEESNAKDDSKTVQQYFDAAIAELSEYYTGKTMTYDEYCEEYKRHVPSSHRINSNCATRRLSKRTRSMFAKIFP